MEDITKKKIGQQLNNALAKKDVKQKDLAKILGVSDNTISYFCSGARVPNTEQLIKISKALDVSTDYLLGLTPNTTTDPDLKFVCDYTGLSEEGIMKLQKLKGFCKITAIGNYKYFYGTVDFIDFLLKNLKEDDFFNDLDNFTDLIDDAIDEYEYCLNSQDFDVAKDFLVSANFKAKVSRACFYDLVEALQSILSDYLPSKKSSELENTHTMALNHIRELKDKE